MSGNCTRRCYIYYFISLGTYSYSAPICISSDLVFLYSSRLDYCVLLPNVYIDSSKSRIPCCILSAADIYLNVKSLDFQHYEHTSSRILFVRAN